MKKNLLIILTPLFFLSSLFSNENKFNWLGNNDVFSLSPITDGIIGGTAVTLNAVYYLCDNVFETKNVTFDGNLFDISTVNSFDRQFMNPYNENLHHAGTATTLAVMASPVLFAAAPKEEWFTIGSMYAESILLANGIKEITKMVVNRPRPYMYYEGYPLDKIDDGDWCKSFPSGHTTLAFTAATFNSYVFCKYYPDSSWKYAVIGSSYALAFTTAGLRMASGNHFFTDVLAGAAIGSLCGFLVPWFHTLNSDKNNNISISPSTYPLGMFISISL